MRLANPTAMIMNLKVQDRIPPAATRARRKCGEEGCDRTTREDKPFCSEHVECHPYVQDLMTQIAERETELARVERAGARAVDPDGPTAWEIHNYLRVHGDRTIPGLARELNIDLPVLEIFIHALNRRGLLGLSANSRGIGVVSLGVVGPEAVGVRRGEATQAA